MDKYEGEEARDKVLKELRSRISKFHQASPEYIKYSDEKLSDCKTPEGWREFDQAVDDTAKVIEEEWETTFAISPKNPGTTQRILQHF